MQYGVGEGAVGEGGGCSMGWGKGAKERGA